MHHIIRILLADEMKWGFIRSKIQKNGEVLLS
jgi:hypothetical protein